MMNENYSTKKRLLAIVLSLMMIFQMMPTGILAEGEGKFTSEPTRAGTGTYHRIAFEYDGNVHGLVLRRHEV